MIKACLDLIQPNTPSLASTKYDITATQLNSTLVAATPGAWQGSLINNNSVLKSHNYRWCRTTGTHNILSFFQLLLMSIGIPTILQLRNWLVVLVWLSLLMTYTSKIRCRFEMAMLFHWLAKWIEHSTPAWRLVRRMMFSFLTFGLPCEL